MLSEQPNDWTKFFDLVSKTIKLHRIGRQFHDLDVIALADKSWEEAFNMFEKFTNCHVNNELREHLSEFYSRP